MVDANEMAISAGVATGVQFSPVTAEMLAAALGKTRALFADRTSWQALQRNGMATDVSWGAAASQYAAVYAGLIAERDA